MSWAKNILGNDQELVPVAAIIVYGVTAMPSVTSVVFLPAFISSVTVVLHVIVSLLYVLTVISHGSVPTES